MLDELKAACLVAESRHPITVHARAMVDVVFAVLGVKPDQSIVSANKGVCLIDRYAVKTAHPIHIRHELECFRILGERYAQIYASGPRFVIQERVRPTWPQMDFAADVAALGIVDVSHNCGTTEDGRTVAYDGFAKLTNKGK